MGGNYSNLRICKHKVLRTKVYKSILLNDELRGLLAPSPRVFSFILWQLPRNKTVVCNKLQNQEIGQVVREMWGTEV